MRCKALRRANIFAWCPTCFIKWSLIITKKIWKRSCIVLFSVRNINFINYEQCLVMWERWRSCFSMARCKCQNIQQWWNLYTIMRIPILLLSKSILAKNTQNSRRITVYDVLHHDKVRNEVKKISLLPLVYMFFQPIRHSVISNKSK